MGISPLVFTGISKFSQDFQTILSRSASIAALPARALEQDQAKITQKMIALTGIASVAGDLASSLKSLSEIADRKALTATTSNYQQATANLKDNAQAGTYTLTEISSLATIASSTGTAALANADAAPIGALDGDGKLRLELAVGSTTREIVLTAATNNLEGLRQAINGLNAGVTATVIQTGTTTAEYRISISADGTGENAIQLRTTPGDAGTNLLSTVSAGSNAKFKINGLSVERKTNSIEDVIPGVTLNIAGKTTGSEAVTITVSSSRGELAGALNDFVRKYNNTVDSLDQHMGEQGGALKGDASVRQVREALQALIGFAGDGKIALRDLGITLDNDGHMSLDASKLDGLSAPRLSSALTFAGSTGLGSLAGRLTALSDPDSGIFETQQEDYQKTLDSLSEQIAAINDRVNSMQLTLQARLQAADVLLARLDSQQNMLTANIQSLNSVLYGKTKE